MSAASTTMLPTIQDFRGVELTPESLSEMLASKRVAYYFSAGWCPMCTNFEPSLQQFREAAAQSGKPVEIIYVGADRSKADQGQRAMALNMLQVPFEGDARAELKRAFKVWPGAEVSQFGTGRRSGVPALVVLGGNSDKEIAFIAAESQGAKALGDWPLDAAEGVWK
eukprot:scaffold56752_cov24-Tisochrysis_lutea.AAC.2